MRLLSLSETSIQPRTSLSEFAKKKHSQTLEERVRTNLGADDQPAPPQDVARRLPAARGRDAHRDLRRAPRAPEPRREPGDRAVQRAVARDHPAVHGYVCSTSQLDRFVSNFQFL